MQSFSDDQILGGFIQSVDNLQGGSEDSSLDLSAGGRALLKKPGCVKQTALKAYDPEHRKGPPYIANQCKKASEHNKMGNNGAMYENFPRESRKTGKTIWQFYKKGGLGPWGSPSYNSTSSSKSSSRSSSKPSSKPASKKIVNGLKKIQNEMNRLASRHEGSTMKITGSKKQYAKALNYLDNLRKSKGAARTGSFGSKRLLKPAVKAKVHRAEVAVKAAEKAKTPAAAKKAEKSAAKAIEKVVEAVKPKRSRRSELELLA